jgi:two-component system cell cycle sensor histidine kinase/response regulator CckA
MSMSCDILIVEDSATQAEALRSLLEESYSVCVAGSAEEALRVLEDSTFQLVLSDIVMPGMSGYDLCRRIKQHPEWSSTPVVLLTSLADPLDIVRGLEAGADNYITKPYEAEHLLARLSHVLSNRRLRRGTRTSMEVTVNFLGTELTITSDKEQILDLLLSSIEDIIRTNRALEESRLELAEAHEQLERYAREKEHEAAVSTERYSTLMQNAGDAILILRLDGRILEANARAAELLGRPPHEVIGRPLTAYILEDQREAARSDFEELMTEHQITMAERAFRRADGTVVVCEGTASMVEVGDERLVLAIFRDITERKAAEATLRLQEMNLREAQAIARLGSWDADVSTGKVSFTEQIGGIFGFPPESRVVDHQRLIDLIHPEDRESWVEAERSAREQRRPFELECRLLALDLVTRVAFVRGRPEVDEAGSVTRIVGVMQDITEQRALERQLTQAQKMEAIGRLAGGVAHDFNNILMAIKGSLHFLVEDLGEDHPSADDLTDIGDAVHRAARLTRQLLAFSRQQVLQPQRIELATLVLEHQRMLRRLLPEDIEIRTTVEPDLWPITADPGQMEQVLMNLVVNARDAIADGGVVSIGIENQVVEPGSAAESAGARPGAYVRLRVSDSGGGIDDGVLEHIFEPFFTTKAAGLGTGLGLSTVYGIVQQSGGHILVQGNAGKGATFDVYLPRSESGGADEEERTTLETPRDRTGTVLLIEDQPEVRRSMARVLRRLGHHILEANGGPQALEIFEAHGNTIDLVITDVVMPKMSGVEISERLRSDRPDLPFLFMSGYLDDEVRRRGLSRSGVQFLEKPFEHSELVAKVNTILAEAFARPGAERQE